MRAYQEGVIKTVSILPLNKAGHALNDGGALTFIQSVIGILDDADQF